MRSICCSYGSKTGKEAEEDGMIFFFFFWFVCFVLFSIEYNGSSSERF